MRSILITGANRGIGLELIRKIVTEKNPQHVFAGCRNINKAEVLQQFAASNSTVRVLELDVTKDATVDAAVLQVSDIVGNEGLDVLINNAGIYNTEPLENTSRNMMQSYFNVNETGPLIITQKFLPLLRQGSISHPASSLGGHNSVLNLTSGYGSIEGNTSGGIYSYRASKATLNMITKSLSIDLRPDNIMAVALDPGWVQTDMGGSFASSTTEECVKRLLQVIESLCEKENGKIVSYKGNILPF
ncbi:C-signal-like [Apostichopus japonicus]|uniref:C-signal-like n=1 Tax=Stichopus japonicus TaxID=307972 RepID=UPI003AB5D6E8